MRIPDVKKRLEDATLEHRLLNHPFYQAWVAGTLTTDDLASYAEQYWRQVEAFPGYLESIAERLPAGHVRRIVEENLADERDGDHPGLWLEFAKAVGTSAERCRASVPESETTDCVRTFAQGAGQASLPFALGMIYGYESQTPEVAETKVTGLRDHYGIAGEGASYFSLHATLDVEHADELLSAIAEIVPDEAALAEAEAGARAGAQAAWGLLSGVTRVRGIAC
jgi:pyrroloquinoline-quinone synthase